MAATNDKNNTFKLNQTSFLNIILTVNAILLAGMLWTKFASEPVVPVQSYGQQDRFDPDLINNPWNPKAERLAIRNAIVRLTDLVETFETSLDEGKFKVQVTNFDEITWPNN